MIKQIDRSLVALFEGQQPNVKRGEKVVIAGVHGSCCDESVGKVGTVLSPVPDAYPEGVYLRVDAGQSAPATILAQSWAKVNEEVRRGDKVIPLAWAVPAMRDAALLGTQVMTVGYVGTDGQISVLRDGNDGAWTHDGTASAYLKVPYPKPNDAGELIARLDALKGRQGGMLVSESITGHKWYFSYDPQSDTFKGTADVQGDAGELAQLVTKGDGGPFVLHDSTIVNETLKALSELASLATSR